mmetsp:Transcript_47790/g.111476  ORF Transcript_47790/g.111476 Transcript_47790/m.111476 type:complete len:282 (+) Transcript_47790:64-909(+)
MAMTRCVCLVALMLGVSHAFVTPGVPANQAASYAASVAATRPDADVAVEAPVSEELGSWARQCLAAGAVLGLALGLATAPANAEEAKIDNKTGRNLVKGNNRVANRSVAILAQVFLTQAYLRRSGIRPSCGKSLDFEDMPSGPSLEGNQDWGTVVWTKQGPKGKESKSAAEVNAARRTGAQVDTDKKFNAGSNKSAHGSCSNATKLDENAETFRHDTVSHDFKIALQQARLAKKMSQAALATQINEKQSVINEYESGKAIPNGAIIGKLNKALGVRLPKAK